MPLPRRPLGPVLVLLAALTLAACESAEERAQGHYEAARALVAEGEIDRAILEFRNALRLDENLAAARLDLARIQRDRGETERAYGHFRLLADQKSGDPAIQREYAELAVRLADFETARAAADRAHALAPADPAIQGLKASLDYRAAAGGAEAREAALALARAAVAAAPDAVPAQMVLIAERMRAADPAGALALADAALAAAPQDEGLHLARLAALEALGDGEGIGAQLAAMAGFFPDNDGVREALVRWHLSRGDLAAAEAELRAMAARDPAAVEPALTVAQFLYETQGPEAARAELDRLAAAAADPLPYRLARARLDFAEGDRAGGIAALQALVDGAEPSNAIRDAQAELARMLGETGDAAGRDALLETVLAGDPRHVPALKLRARAHVAADRPEGAVQDMRTAAAAAPRDPEVMTIMAMAHEREGARELMGERLALAAELSNQAPAEALRYARWLAEENRLGPAEDVLVGALRAAPEDPGLLAELGQVHLARGDWARADQVAAILRGLGDPASAEAATAIAAAAAAGAGRPEETLAALRARADASLAAGGDPAAMAALMQAFVGAGDLAGAQAWLDAALAADPASRPARLMQAGLMATRGEAAAAEALYRALIAEEAAEAQPHQGLVALLAETGRRDAAAAALAEGIAATGGDPGLLLLQAGLAESTGDFEGAIAAYETLYARDSADLVVANNLASLLSAHRTDPESLERAFAAARRLRGSDVPQFQDTYGWILHRRGDSAQAAPLLAAAAAALPGDALVQYHHGEAEFALGRRDAAAEAFRRAIAAAGDGPQAALPQIAAARDRLAEIEAAAAPAAPAVVTGTPDGG